MAGSGANLNGTGANQFFITAGKPEWIEMKPILDVVNEALKAAGKN